MPKGKEGPSIKKPDTYEALRDKGMSKERAAKISNAQANKQSKAKGKKRADRGAESADDEAPPPFPASNQLELVVVQSECEPHAKGGASGSHRPEQGKLHERAREGLSSDHSELLV